MDPQDRRSNLLLRSQNPFFKKEVLEILCRLQKKKEMKKEKKKKTKQNRAVSPTGHPPAKKLIQAPPGFPRHKRGASWPLHQLGEEGRSEKATFASSPHGSAPLSLTA